MTILHLGDSHIASDRITGEVRRLLQARFGDAGRGLMMPGFPFPYYKAPGFSFEKKGNMDGGGQLTRGGELWDHGREPDRDSGADAVLKLASTTRAFHCSRSVSAGGSEAGARRSSAAEGLEPGGLDRGRHALGVAREAAGQGLLACG